MESSSNSNGNGKHERPKKEKRKLSIMQRMVLQAIGDNRKIGNPNDPLRETCPNVYEFMTNTDAGKERVKSPAFLKVVPAVNGYLAILTDPDMAASIEVAITDAEQVWTALERGLVDGTATIKTWGKKGPNFRKRRKNL